MPRTLRTVLICIFVSVAVVAAGLMAVYRYFVTPERVLQLSLIEAGEDVKESFNILSEDEKKLFKDILENGSSTELFLTTENIPLTDGREILITSDSDTNCSVTDVDMGDVVFTAYKDRENLLINTSLFDGGFQIPMANFAGEWNKSIFKDIIEIPEQYSGKNVLSDFVKGKFKLAVYQQSILSLFAEITEKNPVKENKKSVVTIDSKAKKADSYTIKVTKEEAEKFLMQIPAAYAIANNAEKSPEKAEQIKQYFKSLADDYEITVKIYNKKIRELELKNSVGETKTLKFKGKKNPFDTTEFYTNDESKNSFRRIHTERSGGVYEKIYVNDRVAFEFENNIRDSKLLLDLEYLTVNMDIRDKNVSKDSISMPDVQISINDIFNVSGECIISKHFDRDFSFEKKGEYINILGIAQDEWDIVFESLFGKK